jgi:hypothetical protein
MYDTAFLILLSCRGWSFGIYALCGDSDLQYTIPVFRESGSRSIFIEYVSGFRLCGESGLRVRNPVVIISMYGIRQKFGSIIAKYFFRLFFLGLLEGLPFSRRNVQLQGEYLALQPTTISLFGVRFVSLDPDPESETEDP